MMKFCVVVVMARVGEISVVQKVIDLGKSHYIVIL
jgi:hypothetical protein